MCGRCDDSRADSAALPPHAPMPLSHAQGPGRDRGALLTITRECTIVRHGGTLAGAYLTAKTRGVKRRCGGSGLVEQVGNLLYGAQSVPFAGYGRRAGRPCTTAREAKQSHAPGIASGTACPRNDSHQQTLEPALPRRGGSILCWSAPHATSPLCNAEPLAIRPRPSGEGRGEGRDSSLSAAQNDGRCQQTLEPSLPPRTLAACAGPVV